MPPTMTPTIKTAPERETDALRLTLQHMLNQYSDALVTIANLQLQVQELNSLIAYLTSKGNANGNQDATPEP